MNVQNTLGVVASLCVVSAPALAQTSQSATPSATLSTPSMPDAGLEVIVVTAQKREQNLQSVPVSVTALSAAALESQRIQEFSDLSRVAPSLTLSEGTNANNNSINLRGIGTTAFSISVEPSVSVIVDDVATVQQAQAFNNLSDIERIEVLRGPQGTLFGKSASAGVINIVTKAPSASFTVSGGITRTSDGQNRIEGAVSAPITDKIRFRLNGYFDDREGYVTNLTTGRLLNGDTGHGLRARVDWAINDAIDARLIADYSKREGSGGVRTWLSVPANSSLFGRALLAPSLVGITPGLDNFSVRNDIDQVSNNEQTSVNLRFVWDLGFASVTSITAWQDWAYSFLEDRDATDINILNLLTNGAQNGGLRNVGPFAANQVSQELRFASKNDQKLRYLAGLYYSKADTTRSFERGPVNAVANWSAGAGNITSAIFAQLDYDLTEKTRVSLGARAQQEKIVVTFTNMVPVIAQTFAGEDEESAVTGKIALQHNFAERVMMFMSASTGYKGQGFDVATGFNQSRADRPVRSESSISYEVGMKSRFFTNRLQVNATAFLTDYTDFQAQSVIIDPVSLALQTGLNNVGELQTKGVELEVSSRPFSNLRLDGAVTFMEATITSFPTANCYPGQTEAQGCVDIDGTGPLTNRVQNLAGAPLSNAPEIKLNLSGTYDIPLSDALNGFVSLDYSYQSDISFDLFQNPLTRQEAYGLVNGSFGLQGGDQQSWKLTVFVNNLADKRFLSAVSDNRGFFNNIPALAGALPRNSQRYYGVRLKVDL